MPKPKSDGDEGLMPKPKSDGGESVAEQVRRLELDALWYQSALSWVWFAAACWCVACYLFCAAWRWM